MYMNLEWDTAFFGFEIARCDPVNASDFDEALTHAERDGVSCMYALVDGADHELLHHIMREPRATHVDLRLTLSTRDLGSADELEFDLATTSDLAALESLARSAHLDARFFADYRFDRDRVEELYATWIRRSVEGWADRVFTVRQEGRAMGYLTVHIDDGVGRIGLIAMSPEARGQGHGTRLMAQALSWLRARGVSQVDVVTQGRNVGAQRFYQHHGFRTVNAQLWYHVWLRE